MRNEQNLHSILDFERSINQKRYLKEVDYHELSFCCLPTDRFFGELCRIRAKSSALGLLAISNYTIALLINVLQSTQLYGYTVCKIFHTDMQSSLSKSNSLEDRKNVRTTKVRIAEIRIIEVSCLEIFKGSDNVVPISEALNYTSSN